MNLKKYFKKWVLKKLRATSYSKQGEDLQINKLLSNFFDGYYVDIGCWDPINCSNTYYFYLKGHKGICIDPNPKLIESFSRIRPRDNFINLGIGNIQNELVYYELEDTSMNTFSESFITSHGFQNKVVKKTPLKIDTLENILDSSQFPADKIDFFDIDVEGYDLEVLKSNNWNKCRPKLILIESNNKFIEEVNSDIFTFLDKKGYELIAKTVQNSHDGNCFYIRRDLLI